MAFEPKMERKDLKRFMKLTFFLKRWLVSVTTKFACLKHFSYREFFLGFNRGA